MLHYSCSMLIQCVFCIWFACTTLIPNQPSGWILNNIFYNWLQFCNLNDIVKTFIVSGMGLITMKSGSSYDILSLIRIVNTNIIHSSSDKHQQHIECLLLTALRLRGSPRPGHDVTSGTPAQPNGTQPESKLSLSLVFVLRVIVKVCLCTKTTATDTCSCLGYCLF